MSKITSIKNDITVTSVKLNGKGKSWKVEIVFSGWCSQNLLDNIVTTIEDYQKLIN